MRIEDQGGGLMEVLTVGECPQCRVLRREIERLKAMLADDGRISARGEDVRAVFDAWQEFCRHPRAKLTQDRRQKVRARLREGYTREDLIQAVRGAAKGAYVDARGVKWDDLSLICRDGTHVERFMGLDHLGGSAEISRKFLG